MAVSLRSSSRLRFARLLELDGVEHWELPEYPAIKPSKDDKRYVVDRNDRIDRLADRFYGTSDLWWILALANEMELLPNDLNTRETIIVPSQRRVFTQILRRPSRGIEGR